MVSVPVTRGNPSDVQPLNGQFRYAPARNMVGPAVAEFGQEMGRAAEDWDHIEATYDEADATRMVNESEAYKRERLRTGEDAYLTTRGFDAGSGREQTLEDLRKRNEELLAGARSDRARDMARRALDDSYGTAETTIAAHAVEQMTIARDEQSHALVNNATTEAVDTRGTPQFAVNLGVAEQELRAMGERQGWGEERINEQVGKMVSNVYSRTALAMDAEDGEPTRALEFVEENSDLILPGEEARLIASLTPRVDSAWANRLAKEIAENQPAEPAGGGVEKGAKPIKLAMPFGGHATTVPGGQYGAKRSYGGHTGIDYAGIPAGTAVPPAGDGRVVSAGFVKGYGYRVEVDHGLDDQGRRIVTSYSHMDGVRVHEGDKVTAETVLGGVGSTGGNYGTHLHYELMIDGVKVDPSSFNGSVRLAGAPGVPADARLNSAAMRQAVDRYIAANPGISERRQQALYDAMDKRVSDYRADRAQAEQDANRRLQDWLTQNMPGKDDLTDIGQIPASVLAGASPTAVSSINARIQAANSRIQAASDANAAVRAKQQEDEAIFELYTMSDEELANTDMQNYAGRIGLDRLGPWIERQQRAQNTRNNPKANNAPVSADRIATMIDRIGDEYGASRDPKANKDQRDAWVALRGYVERRAEGSTNGEVSNEDLRSFIISGMQELQIEGTGWFGSNVGNRTVIRAKAGDDTAVDLDDLPDGMEEEIRSSLQRAGRTNPTNLEIWTAYQEGRAQGIF